VRELIAAADDEVVEFIFLVEKRGGIPIESCLLARGCGCCAVASAGAMRRDRAKAAVVAVVHGSFIGHKLYIAVFEVQVLERLGDQVRVLFADQLELGGGNADEQNLSFGMAEASGLKPSVVGMFIDLLFEGLQNKEPGIRGGGCG